MSAPITLSKSEYRTTGTAVKPLSEWDEVVREEASKNVTLLGPIVLGLATLLIGVGGFFLWASVTPIAQASAATGRVIVESRTKTVTHLEGGTLKAIMVHEGQAVKEGALLATLDVTRNQSTLTQHRQQLFVLGARLARLIAEKDEQPEFTYHDAVPVGMDVEAAMQLVSTEKKLFSERQSQFVGQIASDRSMVEQLQSQRVALVARRNSSAEQAEVMRADYEAYLELQAKQLVTKSVVNEKKLQLVDMQTRIAESDAALAENNQRKTQMELSLANRRTEYFRAISEQISATQVEIARFRQEIIAAEDAVAKATIRAPQDGVVANIKIRTQGSALIPGQPVLDIVPANQPMLIEGHARAMDIDSIHVGEKVEVRLSAFGASETRPLIGRVSYIAPDGVTDERTGEVTFVFRATIDMEDMKKQPNLFLYPGMTAEVSIVNGYRTALAYLVEPIEKSFNKAFREQ
ncbi:HlyD family type I secretion periplasmic adaptor subunit [Rhizobium sp. KVB221]|uniref:Membrane fusion protein (MFP) family protein n=1 Tax=Rhizobium setariae TaxID=2801340 RepID=A0A936YUM3_9HYPH|nr:HlyD family type I secretion periplasmic adaptor subunit [Rhizobium setariae]MBL0374974.1 HlyD family type I secretion periplasmic adaptor subunit [Rhizobium setariae]